ncbi:hypothetical protein Tco_0052835 [Tanacetum coccineum]
MNLLTTSKGLDELDLTLTALGYLLGGATVYLIPLKKQRTDLQDPIDICSNTQLFGAFTCYSNNPFHLHFNNSRNTLGMIRKTGVYNLPWRAILSLINLCLTNKPPGKEEFIYAIDSFITDKKKLFEPVTNKKKEPKTLLIPYIHWITYDIRNAPYYSDYLELVAKHDMRAVAEAAKPSAPKAKAAKVTKPKATKQPAPKASKPKTTSSQPPKPKPAPSKPSKAVPEKNESCRQETPIKPHQ